ncbi:MAG: hypothetical protein IT585_08705 [candidate division Zixibacteria bacterium]|nr:hypothetical protein [candidate division Zixibacteria bacterium]
MTLKGLLWLLALTALLPAVSRADQQFALYGLQSLTNHSDLPHPAGVGAFLQTSLSQDIRLRFSASVAFDRDSYVATIRRGWGLPFPGDTLRDFWSESTHMEVFEVSFLARPFDSRIINVFVGGGLGLTSFSWKISGQNTGYVKSTDAGPRLAFSLIGDFEIAHPSLRPLVLHLWLRERITMATMFQCDDCGTLFDDSISSTEVSLALALRL